jgi:hypothetical protein
MTELPVSETLDAGEFVWSAFDVTHDRVEAGDFPALSGGFAAERSTADREPVGATVFRLFENICFLMFEPESRNQPYTPAMVLNDRRSFALDDLSQAEVENLNNVAPKVGRADLRGRLHDVVWTKRRDLGHDNALQAIEQFRALEPSGNRQPRHILDCWERALSLGRTIGVKQQVAARGY